MSSYSTDRNHVDGEWLDAADGGASDVVDPATGKVIASVPASGPPDVDRAVGAARRALGAWAETTPGQRAELLLALADAVLANADDLAAVESRNVGKPLAAAHGEMRSAADRLRFF